MVSIMETQTQFQTTNPFTKKNIETYQYEKLSDVLTKIKKFSNYQKNWSEMTLQQRGAHLKKVAVRLQQQKSRLAQQMTDEMGKPIAQSIAEIDKCATGLEKYVELTSSLQIETTLAAHYKKTLLRAEPLGLIFSIQPWNFPFWQVFRMASAAWMAGNLVVLKHSNVTAGCAALIEQICDIDDLPLILNVRVSHDDAAEIVRSPEIHMVTLTGSTRAGRQIGAVAGEALKKQLFELGGSDAYIILADCKLEEAVKKCVRSRMTNSGQSCIAAKRFFIQDSIFSEFKDKFLVELSNYTMGDPNNSKTQTGPLAANSFVKGLKEQLQKATSEGAEFTSVQLENPDEAVFSPMGVLDFGTNLSGFEREEIFGPVAQLYKFSDVNAVIRTINDGIYGLGGAVFTENYEEARRITNEMQVGMVAINSAVQSDARAPFGGVKSSGIGRESGLVGFNEFICWKVVGQGL
jgi:succinate-semialdehyde dehydrogenase / glutarate-semialdehyde dehydrogenase